MNNGKVNIGYHLNNFHVAVYGISIAPSPHNNNAAAADTKPIAPKTRWPVSNIKSIVTNIKTAMNS